MILKKVENNCVYVWLEKPHKCTLCAKSFPTPGDLKSHMYVHNGSWPFKCHICNRGFSKHTNLKNHLFLHTVVVIILSTTSTTEFDYNTIFEELKLSHRRQIYYNNFNMHLAPVLTLR
ncbi:Uncharacterized protein FWK35_00032110 [Aphis craccivora]|uniref:C2H2-type domain-containing protein n=1 Tax=Aphis craccivora TaxID=307492 RepID=A0A6G0YJ51_APHCR|nr:Uncharacterized protein FWK35_00032110 [Aphis craccivora]